MERGQSACLLKPPPLLHGTDREPLPRIPRRHRPDGSRVPYRPRPRRSPTRPPPQQLTRLSWHYLLPPRRGPQLAPQPWQAPPRSWLLPRSRPRLLRGMRCRQRQRGRSLPPTLQPPCPVSRSPTAEQFGGLSGLGLRLRFLVYADLLSRDRSRVALVISVRVQPLDDSTSRPAGEARLVSENRDD